MNISFFEDKPTVNDLDFKNTTICNLGKNLNLDELVNFLVYGVSSCGKTTQIYALLATIFDRKVYDLKNITYEEDKKSMIYKASIYHIEINPITLGSNERLFVQSFLKSYVETRNIGLDIPKVILIKNADLLSKQSQLALRKIIEKSVYTARFIFEVSNLSKINYALMSRFLLIRIPMPKYDDIKGCLIDYSTRKGHNIDEKEIDNVIRESNEILPYFNLKKIFGFYRYYVSTNKRFKFLYYDNFNEIFNLINQKKISFVTFQKIRDMVNEMYINLIPMEELMHFLFFRYFKTYGNNELIIQKLLEITTNCDLNLHKGNKECLHLEHYIISLCELVITMDGEKGKDKEKENKKKEIILLDLENNGIDKDNDKDNDRNKKNDIVEKIIGIKCDNISVGETTENEPINITTVITKKTTKKKNNLIQTTIDNMFNVEKPVSEINNDNNNNNINNEIIESNKNEPVKIPAKRGRKKKEDVVLKEIETTITEISTKRGRKKKET